MIEILEKFSGSYIDGFVNSNVKKTEEPVEDKLPRAELLYGDNELYFVIIDSIEDNKDYPSGVFADIYDWITTNDVSDYDVDRDNDISFFLYSVDDSSADTFDLEYTDVLTILSKYYGREVRNLFADNSEPREGTVWNVLF